MIDKWQRVSIAGGMLLSMVDWWSIEGWMLVDRCLIDLWLMVEYITGKSFASASGNQELPVVLLRWNIPGLPRVRFEPWNKRGIFTWVYIYCTRLSLRGYVINYQWEYVRNV